MFPLAVDYREELKRVAYLNPGAIDEDWGERLLSESEKFLVQDVRK